jgi:hypothetical protein
MARRSDTCLTGPEDRRLATVIRKLLIAMLAFGFLIAAAAFWAIDPFYWRLPKNAQLSSQFQAHRVAFERLREMTQEDSSKGPFFSASHLDQVSPARQEQYLQLFRELPHGINIGVDAFSGSVRFIVAVGGTLTIGPEWVKGIEYLPSEPARWGQLSEQLDDPASLPWGNVYLKQVDPHWYLFVQKTD